jgi:hypothetical protein
MDALTARPNAAGVALQWSTASEVDNSGFVMERRPISDRGSRYQDLVRIGFVPGGGTSTSRREYSYVDQGVLPGRYAYRVTSIDRDGTRHQSLEVEAVVAVPDASGLDRNYPNPFNPTTVISFRVHESGWVRLAVYDVLGREIVVLVDGVRPAGAHAIIWNATGLPSGVYYSRMDHNDRSSTRPLILSR